MQGLLLEERNVIVPLGHRSDKADVLTHLAPKKHYQYFS